MILFLTFTHTNILLGRTFEKNRKLHKIQPVLKPFYKWYIHVC